MKITKTKKKMHTNKKIKTHSNLISSIFLKDQYKILRNKDFFNKDPRYLKINRFTFLKTKKPAFLHLEIEHCLPGFCSFTYVEQTCPVPLLALMHSKINPFFPSGIFW